MSWECGCGVVNKDSRTVCSACGTPRGMTWESMLEHPEQVGPEAKALKQLSDQIGAEFVVIGIDEESKEFRPLCEVRARVKNWTITLDTFRPESVRADVFRRSIILYGLASAFGQEVKAPLIRMRADYVRRDQFYFDIFPPGLSSRVQRFSGILKSIKIGDPNFDDRFIVESNDPSKAQALLANIKIRHLIRSRDWLPEEHISVGQHTERPEGVGALYFESRRPVDFLPTEIKDVISLFELFEETLNQLVTIGSASEEAPNVGL